MLETKKFVKAIKSIAWIRVAAIIAVVVVAGMFCAHGESYPYTEKYPKVAQLIAQAADSPEGVEGLLACYVELLRVPESLWIVEESLSNPKDSALRDRASLALEEEIIPPLQDEITWRAVVNFTSNYAKKLRSSKR